MHAARPRRGRRAGRCARRPRRAWPAAAPSRWRAAGRRSRPRSPRCARGGADRPRCSRPASLPRSARSRSTPLKVASASAAVCSQRSRARAPAAPSTRASASQRVEPSRERHPARAGDEALRPPQGVAPGRVPGALDHLVSLRRHGIPGGRCGSRAVAWRPSCRAPRSRSPSPATTSCRCSSASETRCCAPSRRPSPAVAIHVRGNEIALDGDDDVERVARLLEDLVRARGAGPPPRRRAPCAAASTWSARTSGRPRC